jgi:hypothetical protein
MTEPSSTDDLATRVFKARSCALKRAVDWTSRYPTATVSDVELLADRWLGYLLSRTTVLRITVSPVTFLITDPGVHRPTTYTNLGGGQMAVNMQDNEYVPLTVDPMDAAGNPTADSGLTWAADQPSLVNLVPSADGTACNVGATGQLGTVNITVTDAAGNVSPADPITISSGPATTLGISSGSPVAIPSDGVPTPSGQGG